jgi:hypothetical protein
MKSWAKEALKEGLLSVRAELTSKRSSKKRQKEIAACDKLLDILTHLIEEPDR